MADKSRIEWTRGDDGSPGATWNPVRGCSRVSQGCVNCYAEIMAARFSDPGQWGHGLATRIALPGGGVDHRWTGQVEAAPEATLLAPLRWKRPRRIFVNSTSDLFHEALPDAVIDCVFAVMALSPQHTFQILSKRPERMRDYMTSFPAALRIEAWADYAGKLTGDAGWDDVMQNDRTALQNVWLGTSVEDQATADTRIPHLLATPAAVRFLSAEPLLGPVDLTRLDIDGFWLNGLSGEMEVHGHVHPHLDWVICGGESGPGARPMHPDWARALRDQCGAAGTPYIFKQWGEWGPGLSRNDPKDPAFGCFDDAGQWVHPVSHSFARQGRQVMFRLGKRATGRLLDGTEWNQMPGVA